MRKKYAKQRASRKAKRQGKVTGHMTVTNHLTKKAQYKKVRNMTDIAEHLKDTAFSTYSHANRQLVELESVVERYDAQRIAVDVGDLYDQQRQLPNGWRSCTELGNHHKAAKQAARYMRSK